MDYSKFILLGLIAIAGTGNGFVISQNRTDEKRKIDGGEPICIDKAPYQVYLKERSGYTCGGALIRPNIVLTAAHCLEKVNGPLSVVAGTDSTRLEHNQPTSNGSKTIEADYYIRHPEFDIKSEERSVRYDLAIIKLKDNFPETNNISPIELATVDVKEGDELLITGIGMVNRRVLQLSSCLKAYRPKVMNCGEVLAKIKYPVKNFDGVICHKNYLGYTCLSGDSGSPIVNEEGRLIGIHSSSFRNYVCQSGINVFHYSDWIEREIGLNSNDVL